jgi:hypothetical protein
MYTKQEINGMRKELQYILSKDEDYTSQIDTMALCRLCFENDKHNHEYPDSIYEGLSLYEFFLSVIDESNESIAWEPWEEELKVEWARERKAEEKKAEVIASDLKEETEVYTSFLNDVLKDLETERGYLYIGSKENIGFLRAMDVVKVKLNALETQHRRPMKEEGDKK